MKRILVEQCQAVLIDVQDKLLPVIHDNDKLTHKIKTLIEGLKLLGVPMIANEQYPKGLGHTVLPIKEALGDTAIFEKVTFSSVDDEPTKNAIIAQNRPVVIVFGIETHVCVLQTAMDLLALDYQVVVVSDAVGSRTQGDKHMALARLSGAGAVLVSVEMILFELCRSAKNPVFKDISALVK